MARFKAIRVPARASCLMVAAVCCFSSLRAGTVNGYFLADQEIVVYHSESASDLGERQTRSNSNGYLYFDVDLYDEVTQYLHFVVAKSTDPSRYFIGSLTLEDGGFVFPNGDYGLNTDAVNWVGSEIGVGSTGETVVDLGANGTEPWGLLEGVPSDARLIWTGTGAGDRYFTVKIEPGDPAAIFTVEYSNDDVFVRSITGNPVSKSYADDNIMIAVSSDRGVAGGRGEAVRSDGKDSVSIFGAAGFEGNDFIVSATGGQSTVGLSLNFRLKGLLQGGAGAGGLVLEQGTASAYVSVETRIDGRQVFDESVEIIARRSFGTPTEASEITADPTEGFDSLLPADLTGDAGDYVLEFSVPIDAIITTDPVTVQVGVPFSVSMVMEFGASALNNNGRAISIVDFADGLSLSASGDVFNLPDGFTIDSVGASVADNRFAGEEPPLPFTEGIFLKVGDIKGESKVAGYEEWIDVLDFGSRISRPSGSSGSRRRVSPSQGDLVVEKKLDVASVKFLEGLTTGKVYPETILIANLPERNGARAVFQHRLKNVSVTEFELAGEFEDDSTESVALDFERVDWIYRLLAADGSQTGEVVVWWDVETGTGGSGSTTGSNTAPVVEPVGNQPVDPGSEGSVDVVFSDGETAGEKLSVRVWTSHPDLIDGLVVTGTGLARKISFKTSALWSSAASINVEISDGTDSRSISIPILIGVEMTPFEGFLSAYLSEDEMFDPYLSAPLLDPDGDGLATQLEFLLGTNPREFNSATEAMAIAPAPGSGGKAVVINFRRRIDDPKVKGYFWGSEDMKTWIQIDSSNARYEESIREGANPLYEEVTATVTLPSGGVPLYIRYQSVGVF